MKAPSTGMYQIGIAFALKSSVNQLLLDTFKITMNHMSSIAIDKVTSRTRTRVPGFFLCLARHDTLFAKPTSAMDRLDGTVASWLSWSGPHVGADEAQDFGVDDQRGLCR